MLPAAEPCDTSILLPLELAQKNRLSIGRLTNRVFITVSNGETSIGDDSRLAATPERALTSLAGIPLPVARPGGPATATSNQPPTTSDLAFFRPQTKR